MFGDFGFEICLEKLRLPLKNMENSESLGISKFKLCEHPATLPLWLSNVEFICTQNRMLGYGFVPNATAIYPKCQDHLKIPQISDSTKQEANFGKSLSFSANIFIYTGIYYFRVHRPRW